MQIHSDSKKRRSFVARLFAAGDLRRQAAHVSLTDRVGYSGQALPPGGILG
jgi:hypothetical protein